MAEHTPRRSPLATATDRLARLTQASGGAIAVAEIPFLTQIDLRLDPADSAGLAAEAVGKELGVALPTDPGTSARAGDLTALWLGPDEWLIVAPPGATADLTARLRCATELASVVDVSAQRTTLSLGGPHARDLLAQGCSIDLHERAFAPGRCVQTTLAHAPVVLLQASTEPVFWILVRASFALHLVDWLVDAAVEHTEG
jgi:sarcosine oxidase subunit gamma